MGLDVFTKHFAFNLKNNKNGNSIIILARTYVLVYNNIVFN